MCALSLVGFVYLEKIAPRPVLELGLFKHKVLSPVVLASYLMFAAVFVNFFILPFYIADALKVDAKTLGFLLMLTPAVAAISSPIAGWMSDRSPPAYLTTLALVIVAGVNLIHPAGASSRPSTT